VKVLLLNPKPDVERAGNTVTARRWADHVRALGHDVEVGETYGGQPCDLLVALHAGKSAGAVRRYRERHPRGPLVVALTGTDLYRDLASSPEARATVKSADRLVVLQERAPLQLPAVVRDRVRVIHQSARPPAGEHPPREDVFEVCLLAHMRPVKDPFLAARALRRLPSDSRVRLVHAGRALEPGAAERARALEDEGERYRWVGELPRQEALELLARSRLLVLTSRVEGGANVVTEALACDTPVVSTRNEGSVGLLGEGYPGLVPVGDADALARLLHRLETDPELYGDLRERCRARRHLADPDREREAWARLLEELVGGGPDAPRR
jgi:putative glycosyltransferase (TIGR04348 family)